MVGSPAIWRNGGETWVFVTDGGETTMPVRGGGTAAYALEDGKLVLKWKNTTPGTTPVVAGGLLFVYNPLGGLVVYDPKMGTALTTLECPAGHWNYPIVVDGKIALPEGGANAPTKQGMLDIWTLPGNR